MQGATKNARARAGSDRSARSAGRRAGPLNHKQATGSNAREQTTGREADSGRDRRTLL